MCVRESVRARVSCVRVSVSVCVRACACDLMSGEDYRGKKTLSGESASLYLSFKTPRANAVCSARARSAL